MTAAQRPPEDIRSRANPQLVALRRLSRDGAAYRRNGQVWLEGEHLCGAALARGVNVEVALVAASAWPRRQALCATARRVLRVDDESFQSLSTLESPADVGFVIALPPPAAYDPRADAVVFDRLQDAGNVGSILRSAAALGVPQVLALKGTAALWSPKVLRAGMGAHFGRRVIEGLDEYGLLALAPPLVATSSHAALTLPQAPLPRPCAWLLGHEGQGVSARLLAACALQLRIPQPGGEESLNVAAAASICFYEGLRQRGG
jgi:TrmH family RNA methyltransferase